MQCGLAESQFQPRKGYRLFNTKVIKFVLGIPQRTHLGCSEFSRVNMFNIVHELCTRISETEY